MRLARLPILALLCSALLAIGLAAQADDSRSTLLAGTWQVGASDDPREIWTFGPDKTYLHQTFTGDQVTAEVSGTWSLDGDSLAITIESADPQTVQIGKTLSYGLVSVTTETMVLASDGVEITAKRLSPLPKE